MSLPKIVTTKFKTELPSTKETVWFRPFLVKEEKALLLALESGDNEMLSKVTKDVLDACILEPTLDATKLSFFDVQFLFLQIRAKSVGEVSKLKYAHKDGKNRAGIECTHETEIEIKLDEIKVTFKPEHQKKFMINEEIGVVMRYPTIDDVAFVTKEGQELDVIARCIEQVFDANDVYTPDNHIETVEFLESMNNEQFSKITAFFETMPELSHTIKYECKGCGQEDTVKLEGVGDFF